MVRDESGKPITNLLGIIKLTPKNKDGNYLDKLIMEILIVLLNAIMKLLLKMYIIHLKILIYHTSHLRLTNELYDENLFKILI